MQEIGVQSPGPEDPLEKEMATHSIILAWEIPWTEEPGGLQSMGSQELDLTYRLSHYHFLFISLNHTFSVSFSVWAPSGSLSVIHSLLACYILQRESLAEST